MFSLPACIMDQAQMQAAVARELKRYWGYDEFRCAQQAQHTKRCKCAMHLLRWLAQTRQGCCAVMQGTAAGCHPICAGWQRQPGAPAFVDMMSLFEPSMSQHSVQHALLAAMCEQYHSLLGQFADGSSGCRRLKRELCTSWDTPSSIVSTWCLQCAVKVCIVQSVCIEQSVLALCSQCDHSHEHLTASDTDAVSLCNHIYA